MDFIKTNTFNILASIPLAFVAVGALVINIYLAKYGVIDFSILDGRTAYVGFVCLLQLLGFIVVWYAFTSIQGQRSELSALVRNAAFKPIAYSVLVFITVTDASSFERVEYGGYVWKTSALLAGSMGTIAGFVILLLGKEYVDNGASNDRLGAFTLLMARLLIVPGSVCAVLLAVIVDEFRMILKAYAYISFFNLALSAGMWGRMKDESSGIESKITSIFSKDGKYGRMDGAFFVLYSLAILLLAVATYAKNIYPVAMTNMGGGRYSYSQLNTASLGVVSGKIVHSNGEHVYLIVDNDLSLVPVSEILSYSVPKAASKRL